MGVSASGPTKRWDIFSYIKLAEKINEKINCKFYIAGGKMMLISLMSLNIQKLIKTYISFENLSIRNSSYN